MKIDDVRRETERITINGYQKRTMDKRIMEIAKSNSSLYKTTKRKILEKVSERKM